MPGYTTELSAPPELRMLGIDELVHRYGQCGDPLIERFCYAIENKAKDVNERLDDEVDSLRDDLEYEEKCHIETATERDDAIQELEKAEERIAKLEQQILNLGGVPA